MRSVFRKPDIIGTSSSARKSLRKSRSGTIGIRVPNDSFDRDKSEIRREAASRSNAPFGMKRSRPGSPSNLKMYAGAPSRAFKVIGDGSSGGGGHAVMNEQPNGANANTGIAAPAVFQMEKNVWNCDPNAPETGGVKIGRRIRSNAS